MKRNPDNVTFTWECPECHETFNVSYSDLATNGNPICPDCDEECEIKEEPEEDHGENLKKAYRDALAVQDACNLSGVVNAFSRALSALHEVQLGTDEIRQHPISVLFANKIYDMTGKDFETAHQLCSERKHF